MREEIDEAPDRELVIAMSQDVATFSLTPGAPFPVLADWALSSHQRPGRGKNWSGMNEKFATPWLQKT